MPSRRNMKLHILGIAGTFMGGVAALARELGHERSKARPGHLSADVDPAGNAGHRAAPGLFAHQHFAGLRRNRRRQRAVARQSGGRTVLDAGLRYTSGAQWLAEHVLPGRDLAVAGTHGKTTTTTILAYLLQAAGREPGFLIGGVAEDFGTMSAHAPAPGRSGILRRSRRIRHRVLRQAQQSSSITGRWSRSSTTSNTTTPTSSPTWPRSSASSTTSCAPCRGAGA